MKKLLAITLITVSLTAAGCQQSTTNDNNDTNTQTETSSTNQTIPTMAANTNNLCTLLTDGNLDSIAGGQLVHTMASPEGQPPATCIIENGAGIKITVTAESGPDTQSTYEMNLDGVDPANLEEQLQDAVGEMSHGFIWQGTTVFNAFGDNVWVNASVEGTQDMQLQSTLAMEVAKKVIAEYR